METLNFDNNTYAGKDMGTAWVIKGITVPAWVIKEYADQAGEELPTDASDMHQWLYELWQAGFGFMDDNTIAEWIEGMYGEGVDVYDATQDMVDAGDYYIVHDHYGAWVFNR